MVDVSIVVINYNTYELTCNCLASIYKRTRGCSFEVILVDNASSERNPRIFLDRFPEITLIMSETNLGFSKGNNLGISNSNGQYLVLLNSDTELKNDAISLLVKYLKENSNCGLVGAQLLHPDGRIQFSTNSFPSILKETILLFRLKRLLPSVAVKRLVAKGLTPQDRASCVDWIWGTCVAISRSTVDAFPQGKLHDNFFMYFEDVQWCHYIRKKLKLNVVYLPFAKVIHLGGASDAEQTDLKKLAENVLPNLRYWMVNEKGRLYTKVYFLLHYLRFKTHRSLFSQDCAMVIRKFI